MSFGENILKYKQDILQDLEKVIAIESVSAEGSENPRKALEYVLSRGEELGLISKNINGVAGHLQYGNGKKLCGVLTHLDVVPAGQGWTVPPFSLTRKNGRLYGRGIADDKGSAIVAMYCLKVLKDNNITADSKIRLILGTNEETGMTDVEHYFSKEPIPDMSFTPDSDYGICCCEKGILQISIQGINNSNIIKGAKGGNAVNAVPDSTEIILNVLQNQIRDFVKENAENYTTAIIDDSLKLCCKGKAAHAMEPYKGENSITNAINLLRKQYGAEELGSVPEFIQKYIGNTTDGSLLGIDNCDSQSGAVTVNVGVIAIEEETACVKVDIRYPVTSNYEAILSQLTEKAKEFNLSVTVDYHLPPLNVTKESEIITILQNSYKEITGELPNLYSTGGGTYARSLGNKGVAFGPVFPDDYSNMHKPDESLDEEKFFIHAQICLEAMYKMFTD